MILEKRFIIHKKIGIGSFGCVYSGQDLETKQAVAIKMCHANKDNQLVKEAQILQKLRDIKGFP